MQLLFTNETNITALSFLMQNFVFSEVSDCLYFSPTQFSNYQFFSDSWAETENPFQKGPTPWESIRTAFSLWSFVGFGGFGFFGRRPLSSCWESWTAVILGNSFYRYPKNSFTASQRWIPCLQNLTFSFLIFSPAYWSKSSSSSLNVHAVRPAIHVCLLPAHVIDSLEAFECLG